MGIKSINVNLKSNYLIHFVFKNLLRKRFSDKIISIVTKDRKVLRKTLEKMKHLFSSAR